MRRFVEERALSLWLVVDVSASMRFGPERTTKADRAAQAAALLATAAIQNGDRAGLVLVSDRIELELVPAGGVRHLSQFVRALVATPTSSPKTKLSVGLARVRRTARRAMLVVISDFVTEEPVGSWRRAARRHDTIALRIVDPREDKLPDAGPARPRGCRGGSNFMVDSSSARVKATIRTCRPRAIAGVPSLVRQLRNSGLHHGDGRRSDRTSDRALLEDGRRGEVPGEPSRRPRARAAAAQSWARGVVGRTALAVAFIARGGLGRTDHRLAVLDLAKEDEGSDRGVITKR